MFETLIGSLQENPYFSAGFGLVGVGAGLSLLKHGSALSYHLLKRRLLVSLEIPNKDKGYPWLLNWLGTQRLMNAHQLSLETNYKLHAGGVISADFNLVPGQGIHYFNYKGAWFKVQRQRDGKMMDLSTGIPWESITLTTLSRDKNILSELLNQARDKALSKLQGKTVIYTSYGPEWRPFGMPRKRKPLSSVILPGNQSERLVKDVKNFLENGEWYSNRGIPYRRGYLLYGPPGSGKSSFIQALAGELGYNICILNLSERGLTDDRLNHLMTVIPERSILLLEDIDAAFNKREQSQQQGFQSMVTFSGLLNALDGVAAAEERLIFMTTNHLEKLDPALIRPGRVDVKEYLGDCTKEQIYKLFLRFYEGSEKEATEFTELLKGHKISAASLQGHFVYFKDGPRAALDNINMLLSYSK